MSLLTVSRRPRWTDPDRSASINAAISVQIDRGWCLNWLSPKMAWAAKDPALTPLYHARTEVQRVFESRLDDLFIGVTTLPGWSLEATMYGRTIDDAQPTLICSSSHSRCRGNAKKIISQESIFVDRRGIGLEFHHDPVIFYGGVRQIWPLSRQSTSHSIDSRTHRALSNPFILDVGGINCTSACFVRIAGKAYCVTVAHAFEHPDACGDALSSFDVLSGDGRSRTSECGVLWEKRSLDRRHSNEDYDWALCSLDDACQEPLKSFKPLACSSTEVARTFDVGAAVWVATASSGTINGAIISTDSLVMLPGSRKFQRMCCLTTTKPLTVGDSGSAIYDASTGDLCGFVLAGKSSTNQAYFHPVRKVFDDMERQLGAQVELFRPSSEDQAMNERLKCADFKYDRDKRPFWSIFGTSPRRPNWILWACIYFCCMTTLQQIMPGILTLVRMSNPPFEHSLAYSLSHDRQSGIWNTTPQSFTSYSSSSQSYSIDWESEAITASCVMPLDVTVSIKNKSLASNSYLDVTYGFSSFDRNNLNHTSCVGWASHVEEYRSWDLASIMNFQPYHGYRTFMFEEEHKAIIEDTRLWIQEPQFSRYEMKYDMKHLILWARQVLDPALRKTRDSLRDLTSFAIPAALFALSSIRMNIQPQKGTRAQMLTKIKWVVLSILIPELSLWLAWQQFREAINLKKALNQTSPSDIEATGDYRKGRSKWTLTHAYYTCMGGFVVPSSSKDRRTLSVDAMIYLSSLSRSLTDLSDITVEEITDRSKADHLVTLLTLVQLVWVAMRTLHQACLWGSLTVTGLMVSMYCFYAILVFVLWFEKPRDVSTPTVISSKGAVALEALSSMLKGSQANSLTKWPRAHMDADFMELEHFSEHSRSDDKSTVTDFQVAMSLSRSLGYWHPVDRNSPDLMVTDEKKQRIALAFQAWNNIKTLPPLSRRKLATQSVVQYNPDIPTFVWSTRYWLSIEGFCSVLAYLAYFFTLLALAPKYLSFSSESEQYIWKTSIELQAALVAMTYLLTIVRKDCCIWPHTLTGRLRRWLLITGVGCFGAARLVSMIVPIVPIMARMDHVDNDLMRS